MKPHIKVIQRNGVDVFVTSSMEMKMSKRQRITIGASGLSGYSCFTREQMNEIYNPKYMVQTSDGYTMEVVRGLT